MQKICTKPTKNIFILVGISNYNNILKPETVKAFHNYIEKINGTDTIIILVDNYAGIRKLQLEMWYVNNFDKTN